MGTKEAISNSYTEQQKAQHAQKPIREFGRKALFTGTSHFSGIGSTIAGGLPASFAKWHTLAGDIRDQSQWNLPADLADYDTLIVCHGTMHLDWFEDYPDEEIKSVIDINLTGTALLAKHFVRATISNPWRKHIVVIGSMAHRAVLNGSAPYCAAKAGLNMLTRCLAWELAPKGYDVYCINPSNTVGTVMTRQTIRELARYRGISAEQAEQYWSASMPKARFMSPHDVSDLVNFLLSGKAEFLSGAALDLAGGQR